MFGPSILPGMKQPNDVLRFTIPSSEVGSLLAVAVRTTKGEVFQHGFPTVLLGDDVIQYKMKGGMRLGKVTVFTSLRGTAARFVFDLLVHSAPEAVLTQGNARFGMHDGQERIGAEQFIQLRLFFHG